VQFVVVVEAVVVVVGVWLVLPGCGWCSVDVAAAVWMGLVLGLVVVVVGGGGDPTFDHPV
jgi:hypothetical protein